MKLGELIQIHNPDVYLHINKCIIGCWGKDIPVESCTKAKLTELMKYIKANRAQNTANWYGNVIKAVLNLVSEEEVIGTKDFSVLSVKTQAGIYTYLNREELAKLEKLYQEGTLKSTYRFYLLLFLISAYTGCRQSDAVSLLPTQITNNTLAYVSKKTGIKAEIPAKTELAEWITELRVFIDEEDVVFSRFTYAPYISIICKMAGITEKTTIFKAGKYQTGPKYQFVSGHTARRSFATNLYLAGVDIYTISKMMGHSSVTMTSGYICSQARKLTPEAEEFFK